MDGVHAEITVGGETVIIEPNHVNLGGPEPCGDDTAWNNAIFLEVVKPDQCMELNITSQSTDTEEIDNVKKTARKRIVFDREFWRTPVNIVEGVNSTVDLLLSIVQKPENQKLMNDKKTSRRMVWKKVADDMAKAGFAIPCNSQSEAWVRAYEKWRNLEKTYIKYKSLKRKIGGGHKDPPPYYDKLHEILGDKYSMKPVSVFDSLSMSEPATSSTEGAAVDNLMDDVLRDHRDALSSSEPPKATVSSSKLQNLKPSVNLKKHNLEVVEELRKYWDRVREEDRRLLERHHKERMNLLEKNLKMKEEMVQLLSRIITVQNGRKRKEPP